MANIASQNSKQLGSEIKIDLNFANLELADKGDLKF